MSLEGLKRNLGDKTSVTYAVLSFLFHLVRSATSVSATQIAYLLLCDSSLITLHAGKARRVLCKCRRLCYDWHCLVVTVFGSLILYWFSDKFLSVPHCEFWVNNLKLVHHFVFHEHVNMWKIGIYLNSVFFFPLALHPNAGLGRIHETFRFTSVTWSRTVGSLGRTTWTGEQLVARPLPVHKHRRTHAQHTH
jgi:hypothetical protein